MRLRFTCYSEVWHEGDFLSLAAAQEFAETHMRAEWEEGARFHWYRVDLRGYAGHDPDVGLTWVSSDYGSWANHHIEQLL